MDDPPTRTAAPPPVVETRPQFALVHVTQQKFFAGPLPPPELLDGYERIGKGFADRIIRMAEKEGDHRRTIQTKKVEGGQAARTRGQYLAFSLAALISALGAGLIYTGHELSGFGVLVAAIVPLVTPFLLARGEEKQASSAIAEVIRQLAEHGTEDEEHEALPPSNRP